VASILRSRSLLVLLVMALLTVSACFEPNHELIPPAQPPEVTSGLTPGDVFEVQVAGQEELSGTFEVQEDGTIVVPMLGPVDVRGKTKAEAAKLLEQLLGDGYLRDPHVRLVMTERENLEVSVLGQVQRPGTFPYVEKLTLVQAISEAGGLNELAQTRRVKLTRQGPDGVGTYDVSVKAITEGRAADILLQPGDIIFVPMAPI
jgi:protein involved in polysaccharide export with SLBB domain